MPGKDKNDKLEFEEKNTEFNFWEKKGDGLDGESGYRDLTPESDTKNSEEYIRALHWAIKNKDVKI